MSNVYAVIMAGGKGTRFWPLSSGETPKQFLCLTGKETLLQATAKRIEPLFGNKRILVVTNKEQEAIARKQLPQLPRENIISEPVGKNTAACIGLAAIHILEHDSDAKFAVIPSDHIIKNPKILCSTLKAVFETIDTVDGLLTIGFKPAYPETGYGYIKSGKFLKKLRRFDIYKVAEFTEKPSLPTAEKFIKSKNYFWNSGIFGWKASTILDEISAHHHELFLSLERIRKHIGRKSYDKVLASEYGKMENISIDYAILEKSEKTFVIPSSMSWTDIGSWDALVNIYTKDRSNNISSGNNYFIDSDNCTAFSSEGTIVLLGVKNLITVKSGNKVFVCSRGNSQNVRKVVEFLKKNGKRDLI